MDPSRRRVLRYLGIASAAGLGGCRENRGAGTTGSPKSDDDPVVATTVAPSPTGTRPPSPTVTGSPPPTPTATVTSSPTPEGLSQVAKLVAEDGDARDYFGDAVALSADGTTAVVAASRDEDPGGRRSGSVYVFERRGDWTLRTKLVAEDADPG